MFYTNIEINLSFYLLCKKLQMYFWPSKIHKSWPKTKVQSKNFSTITILVFWKSEHFWNNYFWFFIKLHSVNSFKLWHSTLGIFSPYYGFKGVPKQVLKIRGATSNPQKHPNNPQRASKSAQNEAKRAPKHSKEHL